MSGLYTVKPPHIDCNKCGDPRGFDVDPVHRSLTFSTWHPGVSNDWMEWTCRTCGYEVRTAPLDRQSDSLTD